MTASTAARPSASTRRERTLDPSDAAALADMCAALDGGASIRRSLVGGGRLHVERPLPFLVLYRQPAHDDLGTASLVTTQPAYLITEGLSRAATGTLVSAIVAVMRQAFGAFLLLEVASATGEHEEPDFAIHGAKHAVVSDLAEVLERHLRGIKLRGRALTAATVDRSAQPDAPLPLFKRAVAEALGCVQSALVVRPLFRQRKSRKPYPAVLRQLRLRLGRALAHTFFRFATHHTGFRPPNFHALGRRIQVGAVGQVDERLAEVSRSFSFLMSINPIGVAALWSAFRKARYDHMPKLRYAPLTIDPVLVKRQLYAVPIERIEDPTLSHLFYEKQAEIDRKLTMLIDRGSPRFLLGSINLYGRVSEGLLRGAEEILERVPATARGGQTGGLVRGPEMLEHANDEIAFYRDQWKGFTATAELSDDVLAGMMVTRGNLLVSSTTRTPGSRIEALLQHEVGTHLVTYFNGGEQRIRHLQLGLSGYAELQEGLAVFAEYACGGMTPARLRILAARVIGAHMLMGGATFVDVFRAFCRFGFARRASFDVTLRLFRGGGYTKDLVYLRGLMWLLRYLEGGGALEPLFVGKIGTTQIPIIMELISRGIVTPPRVLPRYLGRAENRVRIERARAGMSLDQLVETDTDDAAPGSRSGRASTR